MKNPDGTMSGNSTTKLCFVVFLLLLLIVGCISSPQSKEIPKNLTSTTLQEPKPEVKSDDYYDLLYSARDGRLYKFGHSPVTVFIDFSLLPKNDLWNENIKESVRLCLNRWESKFDNIEFQMVSQGGDSDITILLVNDLLYPENWKTLGKESPITTYNGDVSSYIRIATYVDSKYLSPNDFGSLLTHEIGHSLGIWEHSDDPEDLMFASTNLTEPSDRDINTLKKLYGSDETRTKFFEPPITQSQINEIDSKIDTKIYVFDGNYSLELAKKNKYNATFNKGVYLNFSFEYPIVFPNESIINNDYNIVVYMDYLRLYDPNGRIVAERDLRKYWILAAKETFINHNWGMQTYHNSQEGRYKVESLIVDLWKQRNYTYVGYFDII